MSKPSSPPVPAAPEPVTLPIASSTRVFPVRRVYCVGRNYVSHIREMAEADERDDPFFFQKPRDAVVRSATVVPYPPATNDFEYEGELVVAIGAGGSAIPVQEADKHVFGLAAGIDLTRRDLQVEARQRGWPWEMGKSFDASAPVGAITPVSGLHAVKDGELRLAVNGVERQKTALSLMIWSPAEIVSRLSRQYRLEPGDLVMTGTPAGVGALAPGDAIHLEITGLEPLDITIGTTRD
jgi:fumarylpyruvate hydrolase